MQTITTHPQVDVLREEFKTLAERLVWVLEEIQNISTVINPPILEQYDKLFRAWEFRLQQKTLEAAELQRREEIFRLKQERGEIVTAQTIEVVHRIVAREFAKIRQRLEDTFLRSKQEREEAAMQKKKKGQPAPELTQQYREVVKFLHPDTRHLHRHYLTDAQKEHYWHATQEAYQNLNYKQLHEIFETVVLLSHNQHIIADNTTTQNNIEAEIRAIQHRLQVEERKLQTLQNNEPYILRNQISDNIWIQEEQQRFEREIHEKDVIIQRSKTYLQTIYGDSGTTINPHDSEATAFQDDFLEHTYFGNR